MTQTTEKRVRQMFCETRDKYSDKPLIGHEDARGQAGALWDIAALLTRDFYSWSEDVFVAEHTGDDQLLRGCILYIAPEGSSIREFDGKFSRANSRFVKTYAANLLMPSDNFVPRFSGVGMSVVQALRSLLTQMTRDKPWWSWMEEKVAGGA